MRDLHRVEDRRRERGVDATQLGRRRTCQRDDALVRVGATHEPDPSQGLAGHSDVLGDQRKGRLERLAGDAGRPAVIGGQHVARADPLEQLRLLLQRIRRAAHVKGRGLEAEPGSRTGGDVGRGDDGRIGRRRDAAVLEVNADHRKAEQGGFKQGLRVDPAHVRRIAEVGLLRAKERLADRDRSGDSHP